MASAAFRMTSAHDFVARTVLLKHGFEMRTLCGDRACRVRGMRVKLRLCTLEGGLLHVVLQRS